MSDKPKIRPVNAFPIESESRNLICFHDPLRIAPNPVYVDHRTWFIISLMDGRNDITDIQYQYTRQFGDLIPSSQIQELITQLDEHLFLDNKRFEEFLHTLVCKFRDTSVRKAFHAGIAYDSDPVTLSSNIDDILKLAGDNGDCTRPVKGLLAPHIDLQAGMAGYAHAYSQLARTPPAQLYVVLGISHIMPVKDFVLCDKDFETPIGISQTDRDLINLLQKNLSDDYLEGEYAHRNEHSIEFQVLFLQHILKDKEYKILPVLCSGFHEQIEDDVMPEMDPSIREFLDALNHTIHASGKQTCIIAGVDLSHVGKKFGTPGELNQKELVTIERLDREMLKFVEQGNTSAFFRHIESDKNGRNVCGFSAIYSLMYMLRGCEGRLLNYDQHVEQTTSSMVSFCSMVFS